MKTILVAINAKYIHPNLAIRLLKKNCPYETDLKEFNIKDDIKMIVEELDKYEVIGFSCYIWNIAIIKDVIKQLKNKPTIFLGGPEVSYNALWYIKEGYAKYVIKNEGEEAYPLLRKHLEEGYPLDSIPNLYYEDHFTFDKLVDLDKIEMAYDLEIDYQNQIVYVETSRGCPYHCSYCMASLDNKVRFFNLEEIKKQLLILIQKKARVFKFLDRTFNANKKYFLALIDFIIENHQNNSFQFEITGDLLDPDVIEYINEKAPAHLFRFEIGIQSTNPIANKLVYRIQNNEKLFNNIRLIQNGQKIDLHLDLIAGLPSEDYLSFQKTFNDCLSLRPKELQLGFLKILHGTKLEEEGPKYHYQYDSNPPYEIISNDCLSIEDIAKIHIAEDSFERFYNSGYMKNTMNIILDECPNPFLFFYELGLYSQKKKGLKALFSTINEFVKNYASYNKIYQSLIAEYLMYFNLKPEVWWDKLPKEELNRVLRLMFDKKIVSYNLDQLFRYSVLVETLDCYILALYLPNKKEVKIINKDF